MISNCIFVGNHAGENIINAERLIIIGDGIRSVPDGAQIVIGETVCGRKINIPKLLRWLTQRALDEAIALDDQQVFPADVLDDVSLNSGRGSSVA